jgi:hypothetical protein
MAAEKVIKWASSRDFSAEYQARVANAFEMFA